MNRYRAPEIINRGPRFIVVAPDLLRADSQENIYVEGSSLSAPVSVSISIWDFDKSQELLRVPAFMLGLEPGNHTLQSIQFVTLIVNFEGYHEVSRVMMVSFQHGYIFVQTDKPIYNPGDTVRFRAYVSSPSFQAFNGTITMEIMNPEGIVVEQFFPTRAVNGYSSKSFTLSDNANEGKWVVTAKFDHRPQNTFRAPFEVKKYVLPAFNVTLVPRSAYLSLEDTQLEVEVWA
ncbi:hypothetical protein CRUP_009090, partial [Coryphaenoides rupestris]